LRFIRNITGKEFNTDIYKGGFQIPVDPQEKGLARWRLPLA